MAPSGRTRGLLRIGEVAERTGLSLRTVRHYEEVGLLPEAERSPGGFRLYTDAAVERLLVIKQMKPLEFSLDELRALLDALDELAARPDAGRRQELRAVLAGFQADVDLRIAKLQERLSGARALRRSLEQVLDAGPDRR